MPFSSRSRVSPTAAALGGSSSRDQSSRSVTSTATAKSANTASSSRSLSHQQVNELAQALQMSVEVRTRKCKNTRKKYKDCFLGSDAVEIILQLAHFNTREEALQVGRFLQASLSLFECVNSKRGRIYRLEDDDRLFYQFTAHSHKPNSSSSSNKKVAHLEEKMRTFQREVQLKDRRLVYQTYKNCFVGREAVDLMMRKKMGRTRAECVEVGRILQKSYNLFVPVISPDHEFEDDAYKFYRLLLPQKEKEKAPSFLEEIKPARGVIALFLIPACLTYYYFYP